MVDTLGGRPQFLTQSPYQSAAIPVFLVFLNKAPSDHGRRLRHLKERYTSASLTNPAISFV